MINVFDTNKAYTSEELVTKALVHGYMRCKRGMTPLDDDDSYTTSIAFAIDKMVAEAAVCAVEKCATQNIVIDWKEHDGINVALIKRPNNKCQPYVVAWNYYHVDGTWGQGHYFSNIVDAVKFYDEEYGEKEYKIVWRGKAVQVSIFLNHTGQYVRSFIADKLEKEGTELCFSFMEGTSPYDDDVNIYDERSVHYTTKELPWYEVRMEELDRYVYDVSERGEWWYEAMAEAESAKHFAEQEEEEEE